VYVFYEEFPSTGLMEIILSSDQRTAKIQWNDLKEKSQQVIINELLKYVPYNFREYNATTKVWTFLDNQGEKVISGIKKAISARLLQYTHLQECKNLQKKLSIGNLSYTDVDFKTEEYKYDEKDFFYAPQKPKGELSGEPLYEALAKNLSLTTAELKLADPLELKKLYRRKAITLHPDHPGGDAVKMAELNRLWQLYNAS
jgi:hypothetical protein